MHGVCFILGSGLAGSGVWADVPPVPIVTYFPKQSVMTVLVSSQRIFLLVWLHVPELQVPSLNKFSLTVSQNVLFHEQQNDQSLKDLFNRVLPEAEIHSEVCGYMLHNGLLFRRCFTLVDDVTGDTICQFSVQCLVFLKQYRVTKVRIFHPTCLEKSSCLEDEEY